MQIYYSGSFGEKKMNRRTAIKNSALVALLGLTDIKSLIAHTALPAQVINSNSFHRFMLGKLELTVITDGHISMKPVQPNFASGISSAAVNKVLDDNFASRSAVDLGINILVVRSGTRLILLDTGCGTNFGKESGWLSENLLKAGISLDAITDVVITHAHPDHIGGLTTGDQLMFPHAEVYLSRVERNFWLSPDPDFSRSKMKDQALKKLVTDIARKNITASKSKLHLFEDGDTLFGCIKMILAPGHTPGHTVLHVFSEGESIFHIADLVHSAVLVIEHPEWGFDGDSDFDLAVQSRIKILRQMALDKAMVFSYHLPWPGIGHVRIKGEAYEWVQQPIMVPD